jgi:hypothetical protein
MFWFDKSDNRAIFVDKRVEHHWLKDGSQKSGRRELEIFPDIQADFTMLPFSSDRFNLVVFDPPHLERVGETSWMARKYGRLTGDWKTMLCDGFSECFRVLSDGGTLIFKWNEYDFTVSEILELVDKEPLFGHKSGKRSNTHWIAFIK